jgi:hypothetical protein
MDGIPTGFNSLVWICVLALALDLSGNATISAFSEDEPASMAWHGIDQRVHVHDRWAWEMLEDGEIKGQDDLPRPIFNHRRASD